MAPGIAPHARGRVGSAVDDEYAAVGRKAAHASFRGEDEARVKAEDSG